MLVVIICCISGVAQESEFLVNFWFTAATVPVTNMISNYMVIVNGDFSTFCFILPELLICGCYFTFLIQCHSGFSQYRNGLTFFKSQNHCTSLEIASVLLFTSFQILQNFSQLKQTSVFKQLYQRNLTTYLNESICILGFKKINGFLFPCTRSCFQNCVYRIQYICTTFYTSCKYSSSGEKSLAFIRFLMVSLV